MILPKILNIHGYKGSSQNAAFEVLFKFEHEVISPAIDYDKQSPKAILIELKNIVFNNNINIIVGTSLGGFFAAILAAETGLPVFLINPCLLPFLYLSKFKYLNSDNIKQLTALFSKITDLDSWQVCTIVGLQDEVLDNHDFTKALFGSGRYIEVPNGKHSGSTLPLDEFFKDMLAYAIVELPRIYNKEMRILMSIERKVYQHNNREAENSLEELVKQRNRAENFDISKHIKAMIHAMLSSEQSWIRVELQLSAIEEIFYGYDVQRIIVEEPSDFVYALKKIKCGNRRLKFQMQAHSYKIKFIQSFEKDYGNVDAFYKSMDKYKLVSFLADKMKELGTALVTEYLRNVGYDLPKPDRHIARILGSERLGYSEKVIATNSEVFDIFKRFSEKTGKSQVYIDGLIWNYCATGYTEICTAIPQCQKCMIRECRKKYHEETS